MENFNFLYLAVMVALVLAVMLLLRWAQKNVLAALAQTLYQERDPAKYLHMLESRRLGLVLRKSSVALLRLEGHIQAGDAAGVSADEAYLDGIKLRAEERLEYGQKAMSFHLARGEYDKGRAYLQKLEDLLEKEPDEKLRAILADARLLIGVYADRDVSLLSALEGQAAVQTGNQKGVTLYRMAKLLHYKGDEAEADKRLRESAEFLAGTAWAPIVAAARADHSVLDER